MKHLRYFLLLLFVLIVQPNASAEESEAQLESRVKAVVLFNFAKYVHWPAGTFASPQQPIEVCVVGKSPFGGIFESAEAPKDAQNRPFKAVEIAISSLKAEVGNCQILFWRKDDAAAVAPLLPSLRNVLTVSDEKSDAALISFVLENDKVRFRIRRKAAEELGFEMSSQLLKLAILDE